MKKKTKAKIMIAGYVLLIILLVNPYIIDVFQMFLSGEELSLRWNFIAIYKDILADQNLGLMFMCLTVFEIYMFISISEPTNAYASDMMEITPDIHIPVPAGQNQCGSARFLPKEQYDKVFASFLLENGTVIGDELTQGGVVIGKKNLGKKEKIYYLPDDTHSLAMGATRSGKTRCLVMQSIASLGLAGESIIATDPKGELSDYTIPFLNKQDYQTWVLDFDNPRKSNHWNFMQGINDKLDSGDVPGAIDETWDLVSQLVGEPKGERIWSDGEASTIAGCILAVAYDNREPDRHKFRNLTNVYYFLTEMCTAVNQVLPINLYKNSLPDNHPAKGLFAVGEIAPSRTRGSFYTSAVMTLKMFTNPLISSMTCKSDFNLADFGKEKTALYIVLPEDRKTYHPLATLFVVQAYSCQSKQAKELGGRLQRRVNYLCDEFGNFAKMPNFPNMLTVGGGKAIRFNLFIQDFAQIEELYEKTGLRTIKGNCENWIYLQADDEETLEIISKKLDKYTVSSYSKSTSSSSCGKNTSSSSSMNLIARDLLTPGEVKKIQRPYSLVMTRKDPAIMYAPDLSKWQFNAMFGMGDKAHNQRLRVKRQEEREEYPVIPVELWGIWKVYQEAIRDVAAKKAAKEAEGGD